MVITLCAFVPMVVISALGWLYAGILRDVVPVELTNLDALRVLLAGNVAFVDKAGFVGAHDAGPGRSAWAGQG